MARAVSIYTTAHPEVASITAWGPRIVVVSQNYNFPNVATEYQFHPQYPPLLPLHYTILYYQFTFYNLSYKLQKIIFFEAAFNLSKLDWIGMNTFAQKYEHMHKEQDNFLFAFFYGLK